MKIPASSSLLIATLAVSSSSSALVPPTGEGQQESTHNSSSSALASSASSESLTPQETRLSEREITQDIIEERGLLGAPSVACDLIQTITHKLPIPLDILTHILCSDTAKEGGQVSVDEAKAQKELSKLSNTLQRATFPSGGPDPSASSSNSTTMAPSDGVPSGNSSRVDGANANALSPNASDSSSAPFMSSMSSSAWRVQPTPTNSPSLPVDNPAKATSLSISSSSDGSAPTSSPVV